MRRAHSVPVGAAGVALLLANQAYAQPAAAPAAAEEDDEEEEPSGEDEEGNTIVVTGTSIRGISAPSSPSVQLNREELLRSGAATSGEITRTLPQVVNIGSDESRRGGAQDAAANRTRTPPLTSRGEPTVVGSVPTKYSSSKRFFAHSVADQSSPCRPTRRSTTFTGSRTV